MKTTTLLLAAAAAALGLLPARHAGAGERAAGPPPARPYPYAVRPGFEPWQRGAYLPAERRGAVIADYYLYRLSPPPRGHHWVRVAGDFILIQSATGRIVDIVPVR